MIVVLVPHPEGVGFLAALPGVRVLAYEPGGPLPAGAADAEVLVPPFLSGPGTFELARRLPNLRLVQLLSAGAEAWIGRLPTGVELADGRGAHGGATAEWVVAVLLSVYRGLPGFVRAQDRGEWAQHLTDELRGKRVLIVGAGDVGEQIVRRLDPFEATTTLVGRRKREGVHGIDEVHGLLPEHDACVIVVPLTDATRGLVDEEFLAAMPDGALIVNGARGAVVDTDALLRELCRGRLRAALDVTDPEPLPSGHRLWEAPGLLLTPHTAGGVYSMTARAYDVVREQLVHLLRGEEPSNLVRDGY